MLFWILRICHRERVRKSDRLATYVSSEAPLLWNERPQAVDMPLSGGICDHLRSHKQHQAMDRATAKQL
jgi:hypothetical protein